MKKNVLIVFGTRPEAIKMLPLIKILQNSEIINPILCVTNQHANAVRDLLCSENLSADYEIPLKQDGRDLFDTTIALLEGLRGVMTSLRTDLVVVHGDTATTYAAALSAFYMSIPVAHVEAGLRSDNIHSPYPEEFYRCSVSMIAKYHFAPTEGAYRRLTEELASTENIYCVGNTVVDSLKHHIHAEYSHPWLESNTDRKKILLTLHRRENLNDLNEILGAIGEVAASRPDVDILYPIHPNPEIRRIAEAILGNVGNISLSSPLPYSDFINILSRSYLVLTDSGGVQEEAGALGIPTLVIRNTTERPELISAGTGILSGTSPFDISALLIRLLDDEDKYAEMTNSIADFGDGRASQRIADILINVLK